MTFSFRGVLRTLHTWGGAVLALLFMLISLTGTFLVWKHDYLKLTIPEARVDFEPTPENLAVIGDAIDRQFQDRSIYSIQFATGEMPLTMVLMEDDQYAYVDTAGNVVDEWSLNGRFEEWVYDLHHRLLLKDLGLTTVGYSAFVMMLLVLFGVYIWWPARRGFRQGLVPHDLGRNQLLKTHRNLGILLALPFLLTLVTGVVLVWPGQTEDILLGEIRITEEYSNAMVENLDNITGEGTGDWLPAMTRASAVFPGAVVRSAQVPGTFSYYRILGLQQPGEWNRQGMSFVYIDAEAGFMDIRIDAQSLPGIERAYNSIYPLHTGRINFLPYKLFLTVVGLAIFMMSSIGLTTFVRKYLPQSIVKARVETG